LLGLGERQFSPRQFWKRIPAPVKEQIVTLAFAHPNRSPWQIAWHLEVPGTPIFYVIDSDGMKVNAGFANTQEQIRALYEQR
jgi:hypothetical protein